MLVDFSWAHLVSSLLLLCIEIQFVFMVRWKWSGPKNFQNGNLMKLSWIGGQSTVGIYLLKVNNRNTRIRCEICSKLTIKIPKRRQWRRSGIFIVNFEHTPHLVLVFLLLTLNILLPAGSWLSIEASVLPETSPILYSILVTCFHVVTTSVVFQDPKHCGKCHGTGCNHQTFVELSYMAI